MAVSLDPLKLDPLKTLLATGLASPLLLALLGAPAAAQLPEWRPYGSGDCELIANHWQRVDGLWTTVEQCRGGRQRRLAISCAQGQITRESEVPRVWATWTYAHGSDLALLKDWCPRLAANPAASAERVVADRTSRAAQVQRDQLELR